MKLVLDFVAAQADAHHRSLRGEPILPAAARRLRAFVRDKLADDRAYSRYSCMNGSVTDILVAWSNPMMGRADALCSFSYFAPGTDACREVARARAHFGAGKRKLPPIVVGLLPSQAPFRRAFEREGFKFDSYELLGKVEDGLRHGAKRLKSVDRSGLTLTRMDLKKDLAAVLRLDETCRSSDPSSRGYGLPRAGRRRDMTSFLTRACAYAPNPVLLMRRGKTLAGLVVASAPSKREDGLIGAISIHPDFQGLGLAHWLYHEALAALDAAGVRWYRGYSSTDAVLGLAKPMKRRIAEVILRAGFD